MSEFLPKTGFKWTDPKDLHSNKYSGNSSKDCILEVDLECSKELHELHNDYPWQQIKKKLKKKKKCCLVIN